MRSPEFHDVWLTCVDDVLAGVHPLHLLGIDSVHLLADFSAGISGAGMAYLMRKFRQFDATKQGFVGDKVIKAIGMCACPTNSSNARTMYHKLKFGQEHGEGDTLWKLDNNGD